MKKKEPQKLKDELVFFPVEIDEDEITRTDEDPSPEEIREACKKLQEQWTEQEEKARRGILCKDDDFIFPVTRTDTEGKPLESDMNPEKRK